MQVIMWRHWRPRVRPGALQPDKFHRSALLELHRGRHLHNLNYSALGIL